jgi:hypothetical protein
MKDREIQGKEMARKGKERIYMERQGMERKYLGLGHGLCIGPGLGIYEGKEMKRKW